MDTCIARIFNTYGPRMRPHDGRAIPTFVRQALEGVPLTVLGDGSQTRSFLYVDDLVRALVLLAESDEHLPINLGNPREVSLEAAETVIRVTGSRSKIVFEALPLDDPKVRQPDITRARSCSAGSPRLSSRKACAECSPANLSLPIGRDLRATSDSGSPFSFCEPPAVSRSSVREIVAANTDFRPVDGHQTS